jgi:uncharacterized protein (TIGR02246 family)
MHGADPVPAEDAAAIRDLAAWYARAVDRDDPELLASLFTPDGVIEGPGFRMAGHAQIRGVPGMLRSRYARTLHLLLQQTVTACANGAAEAETCCLAHHLTDSGGGVASNLVWAIRYQDRLSRSEGRWRFSRRELVIDWTETRAVSLS